MPSSPRALDLTTVTDLAASGAVIYCSPGKELLGVTEADLHAEALGALQRRVDPADPAVIQRLEHGGGRSGRRPVARGALPSPSRRRTPAKASRPSGGTTPGPSSRSWLVLRDVTDVVDAEERLTHESRHDTLTGLPNRALLVEALDAAWPTTAPEAGEIAVLFCDLDGFKRDAPAGHSSCFRGSEAAAGVGAARGRGTAARVGGDEFVILVAPRKNTATPLRPGCVSGVAGGTTTWRSWSRSASVTPPAPAHQAAARELDGGTYAQARRATRGAHCRRGTADTRPTRRCTRRRTAGEPLHALPAGCPDRGHGWGLTGRLRTDGQRRPG